MGVALPPLYGKSKKFYENKKAKCLAKIDKLNKIVALCDEELAKD